MKAPWLLILAAWTLPLAALAGGPVPGASGPALSAGSDPALDPAFVPVLSILYGTNREQKPGRPVDYGSRENGEVQYGISEVYFDPPYRRRPPPGAGWIQWRKKTGPRGPEISNEPLTPLAFEKALGGTLSDGTLLFIHGYNNSFSFGLRETAQLAYDLGFRGMPLLYSWPSQDSLFQYGKDRRTAEDPRGIGQLAGFLREVAAHSRARGLHLMAHSMGCLLLCEALEEITRTGTEKDRKAFADKVGSIDLLAADICKETFETRFFPALKPYFKGRTALYVSDKDEALKASAAMNQCVRLGQGGGDATVLEGLTTIDASPIAVDWGFGHFLFSHDGVIDDLYLSRNRGLEPAQRLLTLRDAQGGTCYEIFDGVHQLHKPSDFNWALGGQLGLGSDGYTNLLRLDFLMGDGYLEPSLGIQKGFLPSQVDLRVNLSTGGLRPYLNCGVDYYEAGSGDASVSAWAFHYGLGLEWVTATGWGWGLGLNRQAELEHKGVLSNQPTIDALLNNRDFPWGGLSLQVTKYFDLEI